MATADTSPLEQILRLCAAAAPNPWYPSVYAQSAGIPRDRLDPHLDRLRMAGIIRLTDWVQGKGQGYVLTDEGARLLESPRQLARLQKGDVPQQRANIRPGASARGPFSTWDRGEAAREALLGSAPPYVTMGLIAANVAVFLAGMYLAHRNHEPLNLYLYKSTPTALDQTGALTATDVYLRAQWWRLLACCFVHIGVLHLGVNMYSLYVVGPLLERMWGSLNFFILYIVAGLAGSCAMLWDNPEVQGAGASGALWGILASMVTWIAFNRHVLPPSLITAWRRQLLIVFLLNLGITLSIPSISKEAHFGGGAVGLIAAIPLDYLRFGSRLEKVMATFALAAIPVACVMLLVRSFERNADAIEAVQYRRERAEFFGERIRDVIDATNQATVVYFKQVRPLINTHFTRRDADEVRNADKAIAHARGQLQQNEVRLLHPNEFVSQRITTLRAVTIDQLKAWDHLLELSSACLNKEADCTMDEETAIDEQSVKALELRDRWLQALRKSRDPF